MSNILLREVVIKKPKKHYVCECCGKNIAGEHIYQVGVAWGNFQTIRVHIKCNMEMLQECSFCHDRNDCDISINNCYSEMKDRERC